ncbi:alpha-galactosidase [Paenibacillus montanisoli]|uniref:Alpha-galactosidase n=1 Tax=Paenibacillus montanisoli TaxID=2081970 RepID=A0A328UB31_9BACL|nr:alpha-galactosidase [Paenibacillus montanisoli]RAP77256.1 alpha-galactosidase [Paenibacillus montanisoli]
MQHQAIRIDSDANRITVDNGLLRIESNLQTGLLSFQWKDGSALRDLFSEVTVGSQRLRTTFYSGHQIQTGSIQSIEDRYGKGVCWCVEHAMPNQPILRQHFWCYEGLPYGFVELQAEQETEWETNEMTPLSALRNDGSCLEFGQRHGGDARVLFVPFDNDKWVRYGSFPIPCSVESCEATAIYCAESRHGFVLGSVTHDFWKTGLQVEGTFAGEVSRLRVFGGLSSLQTRDTLPHGSAHGKLNVSPRIFVGSFEDYRDGLEAYGRANAAVTPMLPWDGGVPFGWNSWSAVMSKLDFDVYVHTSDFIKQELQAGDDGFTNQGAVYVNFDSFWTNLTPEELREAVRRVKANGHRPGIYFSPFAYWGKDPERPLEGSEDRYLYRDILLKDAAGNLLPTLDGAYAIDLSHPAALERIRRQLDNFVELGFEYVKADFLSHGALEGRHYDPEVRTGIEAYNRGMAVIRDTLAPERIGRPFFINLSIAPLFPHGYAHSRRISCDVFGTVGDTEYMLNALTYGWWINGTLYRYNDPDHTVLYKSANQRSTSEHEGRGRLTASVIAGTSLLLGDDFRMKEAAERARAWMTHPDILALARKGITFRPVEGSSGSKAEDIFVLSDAGESWVAVFNYDSDLEAHKRLMLERLGIPNRKPLRITDVWDGSELQVQPDAESIDVHLSPSEAKLLRIGAL